ncbi:ADP compounds hydrolase NudE [Saccharophagus degradans]|uniref:Transcription termination factor Rho n=1 Tax=Saccharophagus degradans (strain 2-40 / ATCC 43961 / DSM 17024) TaxID=203122 RepID=Q21EK1_SACD2|nr:ADP compounds hydrolase NudE [Saccharophagus degradans]ABD82878.1 transcription termination factor Rho [Saccharophagus degradans 2-40]
MPSLPKILQCQQVAQSKLFRVEQLQLQFSNGEQRTYERLAGGKTAAVIIVPMLDNDTVLLIREYGVGVEGYELGLPKGKVDAGETHMEAANRELKEEVGYGAKDLQLMKCLSQSPNYMQHKTQIVLARNLYPERLEGDEPEPLDVVPAKLSELEQWIARDDLTEARSIAALLLARQYLQDLK